MKHHQQNTITHVANESTLHACELTLRDGHAYVCTTQGVRSAIVQN